jgi:hypothetical protein
MYAHRATRGNNAATRSRVLPHEMACKLGAEQQAMPAGLCAVKIGLGRNSVAVSRRTSREERQAVLLLPTMRQSVYRRLIDEASIVTERVNPAELIESSLERSGLLFVAPHVAVDVMETGAQLLFERLAEIILDVEADDLLALADEVASEGFAYSRLCCVSNAAGDTVGWGSGDEVPCEGCSGSK